MPARLDGGLEERCLIVALALAAVCKGSRHAPPWMKLYNKSDIYRKEAFFCGAKYTIHSDLSASDCSRGRGSHMSSVCSGLDDSPAYGTDVVCLG
jgi:hypothetical protein